jgi:DNA-binding CsgD family transcriptional regulator
VAIDVHSQAELTSALLDGAYETPLWSTFLDRLRARVAADRVTLIFRPPGRPLGEALHLFSGDGARVTTDKIYRKYLPSLDLLSDFQMRENRVYTFTELYPPRNPNHRTFYKEVVVPSGITAALHMRVMEPAGVSAWLVISRRKVDFDSSVSSLLEALAPILRGVLRNYITLESVRFTAAVTGDAMRRLHFGWMALDVGGHVVDFEPEAGRVLSRSGVLRMKPNGGLVARPAQLERDIFAAITKLAADPLTHPSAFILKRDPWLDMLLVPAAHKRLSAHPRAAVIAYVHGDSWRTSDRCEQLVQLFGLSAAEARLALELSRGLTLTEAAGKLELKVGTVRKYSKTIYAKLGARGLPDLVRIVLRSVLSIAPQRSPAPPPEQLIVRDG